MNMNLANEVEGLYRLTVRRRDGSVRLDTGWFKNLILNAGLNSMGTAPPYNTAYVGSGSTPPVATNTTLENQIGTSGSIPFQESGYLAVTPYYGWLRYTFRFPEGTATGNLSEVGVGYNTNNFLFSRALILDGNGTPTTITVLADEVLDVAYELRLYPPLADNNFNLTIAGVVYACKMRAARVNSANWTPQPLLQYGTDPSYLGVAYGADIGTMFEAPSGDSRGAGVSTALPYANNSLKRGYRNDFDLDQGNFEDGIKSLYLQGIYGGGLGAWQCSFTPPIPKTNTKKLSLTAEIAWARKV